MDIERLACDLNMYPVADANRCRDSVIVLHLMFPNDCRCEVLEPQIGICCMAQITRGNDLKEIGL